MSWRVITGILFAYIMLVLLSTVATEIWIGSNETTIIDYMVRPETPTYNNPVGGISQTFVTSAGFMTALFKALWLESPLWSGEYQIIRWLALTVTMGVCVYWVVSGRQSM
jgi:hypothetical protein